jgi:glutamate dehydrogenase (NAD(P)+)
MSELFGMMDEFGPEEIVCVQDTRTGMKGCLVIDNSARGLPAGGCRMTHDLKVSTVCRLARTMTWKYAMFDINLGGAKSGIMGDPNVPNKEEIVRSFARALKDHIPAKAMFGGDLGIHAEDVAVMTDELGERATMGWEFRGISLAQLGFSGYGVAVATQRIAEGMGSDIKNIRVSVQGFGAVGSASARFLADRGAAIVAISSIEGVLYDPNGLDIGKLIELMDKVGDKAVLEYSGGKRVPLGEELTMECDVLVPAAKEDIITMDNVRHIKARVIVEGANMPITQEAQKYLHENGIFVLPDFVANAGAVATHAIRADWRGRATPIDTDQLYPVIETQMQRATSLVFDEWRSTRELPREIALRITRERVRKAMELRGRFPKRR